MNANTKDKRANKADIRVFQVGLLRDIKRSPFLEHMVSSTIW